MYLVVYVDDFIICRLPKEYGRKWRSIQKGVNMGKVEAVGLYLGCHHKTYAAVSPYTGRPIRVMEYDMSDFLRSFIEVYEKLTGATKLRKASTPL